MNKVAPIDDIYEEYQEGLRKKFEDVIDGKIVTISMACVTIWVLFGDDIRILNSANKESDYIFYITYNICLALFLLEIILNSIFIHNYKFTFFF